MSSQQFQGRPRGTPKCRWTKDEDKQLVKSVEEFGIHNWNMVATKVGGRSSKQCRERWIGKLSPDVVSTEWTEEENNALIKLHEEHGNQWAKICKYIKGRSMIAVKNRWCCIKKKVPSNKTQDEPIEKEGGENEVKKEVEKKESVSIFGELENTFGEFELFGDNFFLDPYECNN